MEKKKGLKFYWDFMDVSVMIFVVYSILATVFPLTNLIGTTLASIIGFLVMVFAFGLVGFRISRRENKKEEIRYGKAGAWTGAVIGFISAAIAVLAFYLLPATFADSIQKAVNAGASVSTVRTIMQVFLFLGFIIYPLIYGLIGALIVWVSKFIFGKNDKAEKEWIKESKKRK